MTWSSAQTVMASPDQPASAGFLLPADVKSKARKYKDEKQPGDRSGSGNAVLFASGGDVKVRS
jgi:hypothetical protein